MGAVAYLALVLAVGVRWVDHFKTDLALHLGSCRMVGECQEQRTTREDAREPRNPAFRIAKHRAARRATDPPRVIGLRGTEKLYDAVQLADWAELVKPAA